MSQKRKAMMAADAFVTDMADLKDLDPLSKRLRAAQDDLNQVLQTIQDRLNAYGLGIEAWAPTYLDSTDYSDVSPLDRDDVRKQRYVTELGYGRHGDGWALLVRVRRLVHNGKDNWGNDDIDEFEHEPAKPLLKASRALRAESVERLPALIEILKAGAEQLIDRVEQAKKIADSL
jgi:hypothetical protein